MKTPFRMSAQSLAPWFLAALCALTTLTALSQSLAPGTGRYGVGSTAQNKPALKPAVAPPKVQALDGGKPNPPALSVDLQDGKKVSDSNPSLAFYSLKAISSGTQQLAINNTSDSDYVVTPTSLSGAQAVDFTFTNCANSAISKGDSCAITILYTPHEGKSTQRANASLGIQIVDKTTKAVAQSFTLNLAGNIIPLEIDPLIGLSAAVGSTSSPQTITIRNTGSETVTLDHPLSVDDPDEFTVTDCGQSTLAPKQKCVLSVVFTPKAANKRSAVITIPVSTSPSSSVNLQIPLSGSQACSPPGKALLPLSRGDVSNDTINCYFNATSNLAFVGQVHYLYNPGGSANTLAGDLASLQFPGGVQINLDGAATVNSCSTTGTNTATATAAAATAASNNSCNASTTGTPATSARRYRLRANDATTPTDTSSTSQSLEQAIQSLTKGGDFGLRAVWPLVSYRHNGMQFISFAQPRVGFNINGLTAQNTITNATEVNANFADESYFQLDAIPSKTGEEAPGSIFADYRAGWEHVSSTFAANAGLPGSNFVLQQFSAGILYKNSIRISAQRYFGPSQAYIDGSGNRAKTNNFSNWQLAVQITPTNVVNGGKK